MDILEAVRSDFVTAALPEDVREIIAMLNGRQPSSDLVDRRQATRHEHNVRAAVEIGDSSHGGGNQTVYTRDVSSWGIGFISRMPLPPGSNAMLHIDGAHGRPLRLMCCVLRCREVLPGWFEGAALLFNEEPMLAPPTPHHRAG
ncbi:MAG: hypothetical protein QOF78_3964 [Phycisphaerales bacterium]|jgi:hypothetical protein|nr:hypothetical protein [Phycisphaerales bacterium]